MTTMATPRAVTPFTEDDASLTAACRGAAATIPARGVLVCSLTENGVETGVASHRVRVPGVTRVVEGDSFALLPPHAHQHSESRCPQRDGAHPRVPDRQVRMEPRLAGVWTHPCAPASFPMKLRRPHHHTNRR